MKAGQLGDTTTRGWRQRLALGQSIDPVARRGEAVSWLTSRWGASLRRVHCANAGHVVLLQRRTLRVALAEPGEHRARFVARMRQTEKMPDLVRQDRSQVESA